MQLTEYARTEVCVQPVTSYVTEPITTYLIIRSNGVKVDRSRPDHAMLPSGANVPMKQHFAYLYFSIYRMVPSQGYKARTTCLPSQCTHIHLYWAVRRTSSLLSYTGQDVTQIPRILSPEQYHQKGTHMSEKSTVCAYI